MNLANVWSHQRWSLIPNVTRVRIRSHNFPCEISKKFFSKMRPFHNENRLVARSIIYYWKRVDSNLDLWIRCAIEKRGKLMRDDQRSNNSKYRKKKINQTCIRWTKRHTDHQVEWEKRAKVPGRMPQPQPHGMEWNSSLLTFKTIFNLTLHLFSIHSTFIIHYP